jgi:hypothetical protein
VQPKYGGMIIDIVSREIRTPEQQAEALDAIRDTILDIVLIVVIGYDILSHIYCPEKK